LEFWRISTYCNAFDVLSTARPSGVVNRLQLSQFANTHQCSSLTALSEVYGLVLLRPLVYCHPGLVVNQSRVTPVVQLLLIIAVFFWHSCEPCTNWPYLGHAEHVDDDELSTSIKQRLMQSWPRFAGFQTVLH